MRYKYIFRWHIHDFYKELVVFVNINFQEQDLFYKYILLDLQQIQNQACKLYIFDLIFNNQNLHYSLYRLLNLYRWHNLMDNFDKLLILQLKIYQHHKQCMFLQQHRIQN
jgi:hypothetical protein